MSVFLQNKGETIVINGDINVTVLDINGDAVVLGIDAPRWMEIDANQPERFDDEPENWSPPRPR
jgi:carbon storage regulator CsrA